jgi:hypothetical protein
MAMRWLEKKVDFLGALDPASNAQAKALLASFVATDGQNCVTGYGLEPGDIDPVAWATRDGKALACFANWWNANAKTPNVFPAPGVYTWTDLKAEHLQALQQWGLEKGVINAGQLPLPPGQLPSPTACALACQQKYATDPVNLATCLAICGASAPPPPAPAPPQSIPPLPPPPAPIQNQPSSSSSSTGGWVVAGLVALAIGVGLFAMSGSSTRKSQ